MKKVIIAGASSFIGMHLVQRLVKEKEYDVTGVVRPKSKAIEKIRKISEEIKIIELELENYPLMYQYIDHDIDCFIPLTWAGTRKEERDDWQIQNTCMELMTGCVKNLIENCALGCIITPGSVAEYGNGNKTHEENSVCCPDSMYGKGKLEFFNRTREMCQNRGIDYYHIRIFSIYGPDDYDRKIINTVVGKLLLNENFSMSSCEQQWNLLYIDDLIDLFFLLLHKEIPQGCYNVGARESVPLRTYIERIEESIESEGKVFFGEKENEHLKSTDLTCNIEKLVGTGKWQPRVEFSDGIQKVIAYMSDRLNKDDAMEGKMGETVKTIHTDKICNVNADMTYEQVRKIQNASEEDIDITIMVQAYGRLEKTKLCVESILKYTKDIPFLLLLEDNGTEEGELLQYFESVPYERKKIIKITKNITGVYGIDIALRQIKTKYLVVVLNDIIVTPNWLNNLYACAESDSKIGMICPVSTNISNYQLEKLGGFDNLEEMFEKAEKFNVSNPLLWEEKIRLIPTATLYRTEVFRYVGEYDVGFIHDFGDDDFSFRVRRSGYRLICCRDTFVHHNHDVLSKEGKNIEQATKLAAKGRIDFSNKHNGIDAWNDTQNDIFPYLQNINFHETARKNVLVLEPKCGTPVLDIKNMLRKQEIFETEIETAVSNVKYYQDLLSVSQKVSVGKIESLVLHDFTKMYDMIVLCEPVNMLEDAAGFINHCNARLKKGGIMLFPLRNTCDYRNFLCSLNVTANRELEQPRVIFYGDIMDVIKDWEVKKCDILCEIHLVETEMTQLVKEIFGKMFDGGDCQDNISRLFVKNYWFIISK